MLKTAKKYILSFPGNEEKRVLELMKKDWNFEVIDRKEAKDETIKELQKINHAISSLDFVISYLSLYAEKQPLLEKIKNPKASLKKEDIAKFHRNQKLDNLVKEVIEIEKEFKSLEKENEDNQDKLKELEEFNDLNFVPKETRYTFSLLIKIEAKNQEASQDFCSKEKFHFKEVGNSIYVILGLKERKESFLDFLKEINGETINYSFSNLPSKEKEIIKEKIEENEKKEDLMKEKLREIAESLLELKTYHDVLCLEKRQIEVKKRSFGSLFLNYVVFFAPEEEKVALEKQLPKDVKLIEIELERDENPPVYMENSKIMEPFESVTNIFGLPSNKEIDPTPYLSLFFIIFFGICITDAGYGLLLTLFTGLALLIFKKRLGGNKLIRLLFYGGISTFIIGVLFGSYFGVSPEQLHIPFMRHFKVIDSVKDTVLFMEIAFLLGYIQICFSQVVRMIKAKRFKDKEDLLAGGVWLSFFVFVGIYILSLFLSFLRMVGLIGLVASFLGLFLVESRGYGIFLKPLIGGIKILQELINTVSDVLSYSRLMALGLGTGVIALVVNQIAFLLGGMVPYVGWIVAGLILVAGHLFNLGINALGGFIHSARLQFVEFFPKFMEGGGRRLDPISQELKYIEITK